MRAMSASIASSSTSARRPAAICSGQGSSDGRLEGRGDVRDEHVEDRFVGLEEAGLLVAEDLVEGLLRDARVLDHVGDGRRLVALSPPRPCTIASSRRSRSERTT